MKWGSLFSGISGFDLAIQRVGHETLWMIENDKNNQKKLKEKFPGVPIYGDIRNIDPRELPPVDGICGGWPCQDLSVAGKRAGLAGQRSRLFFEICRFLRVLQPNIILLENVPGLLSSNGGRDMVIVIKSLSELGYMGSWRILNARHFGVAQNRRRIFFVGFLGGKSRPEVLFEPESYCGDVEEIKEVEPKGLCILHRDGQKQDPSDEMLVAATLRRNDDRCGHRGHGKGNFVATIGAKKGWHGSSDESYVSYTINQDRRGGCHIQSPLSLRRLTPLEKERLMGFPDGHTEGFPDSVRGAMLGNAVVPQVVEWILRRLND